jgi:ubiquitin C-terminal hydrolase
MSQQCDKSQLRYKIMGTVNHFGTLNRGHFYV